MHAQCNIHMGRLAKAHQAHAISVHVGQIPFLLLREQTQVYMLYIPCSEVTLEYAHMSGSRVGRYSSSFQNHKRYN